jgi:phage terminase small subunit
MNKLTHTEEMFVAEYIKNGGNGKQAYMTVRPKASMATAKVNACKMLKRPAVKRALQEVKSKKLDQAIASREYLINQAHEIGKDAYKKEKHGAALKSVELKGKLNNVFEDKESDLEMWKAAVQRLGLHRVDVNVNINKEEGSDIVDVTPERDDK